MFSCLNGQFLVRISCKVYIIGIDNSFHTINSNFLIIWRELVRIERDSGSEPLLVADEHSSSCWKGKAERVQLGDLLRLGSCVLHPPPLPLLTNNDMLKGTAVKMSSCLAIVLKEERRGAYCSSHTHRCTEPQLAEGSLTPNVCKKTPRLLWLCLCNVLALWAELYKSCSFNMWL